MFLFQFGENVKGFDVKVLNEREIRAGAGILFLFAIISFMFVLLLGNFYFIKIFIIAFLVDFVIRLFINPKFSPSLILGRLFVRNQTPEYVSAKQKKFAWFIGLFLVTYMFIVMVIFSTVGPINLLFCLTCLVFLFFESVLGICLGCKVHYVFYKEKPELCAGGVCKVRKKEPIQKTSVLQIIVLLLFLVFVAGIFLLGMTTDSQIRAYGVDKSASQPVNYFDSSSSVDDCIVPQWAIDIGHEDLYKEHHGCVLS